MTEQEIEAIVEKAANKAVQTVFSHFGLNIQTLEDIREVQDDFRYTRFMRKLKVKVGANSISLVIKVLVGCAMLYLASRFGVKVPGEVFH